MHKFKYRIWALHLLDTIKYDVKGQYLLLVVLQQGLTWVFNLAMVMAIEQAHKDEERKEGSEEDEPTRSVGWKTD